MKGLIIILEGFSGFSARKYRIVSESQSEYIDAKNIIEKYIKMDKVDILREYLVNYLIIFLD